MKTRGLKRKLISLLSFLMLPFSLVSIESREFNEFFYSQDERELEKIQKKEASVKKFSEKYILTFFYFGDQARYDKGTKHVQDLVLKYNWTTYAISLDGILVDGFDNNKIDNGIYKEFQNRSNAPYRDFRGPSIFLFNPQTNSVRWITSGSSEFDKLEDLFYLQYQYFGL
jgi:F plasmid transfer operon protein